MFSHINVLFVSYSLLATVCGQGQFTNPSGGDGTTTFTVGQNVTITWLGTEAYPVFSMGLLSGFNRTISWLISNSEDFPDSYQWTVDPASLGFDLSSTSSFSLYACNGSYSDDTEFTIPFASKDFNIADGSTTTSSLPTSSTAKSTSVSTASTTATTSNASSTSSATAVNGSRAPTPLSIGAQAGIGIGFAFAVLLIAGIIAWFCIQRRKRSRNIREQQPEKGNASAVYLSSEPKSNGYHELPMPQDSGNRYYYYEAPTDVHPKAQLPTSEAKSIPVELEGSDINGRYRHR